MTPTWTILIATLGRRGARFSRLLGSLLPQAEAAGGAVTIQALWNNGERPVGQVRQDLLEHATARYVSFVDDDDYVPDHYVAAILPLLDGVDYVGFKVKIVAGEKTGGVASHSLQYQGWREEPGLLYYRDISHLNPVRRAIACRAAFPPEDYGEDRAWAEQLRPHVHTECFLDDVMYFYAPAGELRPREVPCVMQPVPPPRLPDPGTYTRPVVTSPWFSWHPASSPALVPEVLL